MPTLRGDVATASARLDVPMLVVQEADESAIDRFRPAADGVRGDLIDGCQHRIRRSDLFIGRPTSGQLLSHRLEHGDAK